MAQIKNITFVFTTEKNIIHSLRYIFTKKQNSSLHCVPKETTTITSSSSNVCYVWLPVKIVWIWHIIICRFCTHNV